MVVQSKEFIANPIVTITVITYNHRAYISQCLDSILAQNTDYKYEVIIADDCSTDGTRDILISYQERNPKVIKLILQDKNLGLIGNYASLLHQCRGKYISQSAGDDFFYDTQKIQMQVDMLEKHPECDLCYTNCYTCDEVGIINKTPLIKDKHVTFEYQLLNAGYLSPCTWVLRRKFIEYMELQPWFVDDSFAVSLDVLYHSTPIFIDKPTSVYRVHQNSLATQKDPVKMWKFMHGLLRMQLYYADKYKMSEEFIEKMKIQEYHAKCFAALEAGDEAFVEEGIQFCK